MRQSVVMPSAAYSLPAKLIGAFLLVSIPAVSVMAAIGLYALRDLTGVNDELQEISRSLEAVQGLKTAVAKTLTPLSAYLVDRSPEQAQHFVAALGEVEARLKNCSNAACHGVSQQPRAMVQTLAPHLQGIRERAALVFGTGRALTELDRLRAVHDISQESEQVSAYLARMSSALLLRVAGLQEWSAQMSRRATALIVVSASLVLALAAITAYLLSRRLLKHLNELLAGTRHIMQGNLRYRLAVKEGDEIGQLAQSFNAMAEELQQHRAGLERNIEAKTTQLRQARDTLIQSEKLASIGLLAAGVAHELNNPLTSILMNVNLLMEDANGQPALQRELDRISDDTVRCKRIIDDLRDFSRRHELDIVPTDVNLLVREALAGIGRRLEAEGIAVVVEFAHGLPLVPCDPARIEQVLANVLVNALQAMPQGGHLTVATAPAGDSVRISIADTGTGIAAGIRSRIFDPFFTTKPQGTGLGLSIVYRIMEAHGGRVEVESTTPETRLPRGGTRVVLSLPLAARHSASREADHRAARAS